MNRHQILELYMILGGIPYYLDMLRKDLPLTKNIDNLFFKEMQILKQNMNSSFVPYLRIQKIIERL